MGTKKTIGILSPYFAPFSAYERAADLLGIRLAVVTPKRILWQTNNVEGLVWEEKRWRRRVIPLPQSMYNRFFGSKLQIINQLEAIIGANKIFNHVTHFDKWETHCILAPLELGKFLPFTCLYTSENLKKSLVQYEDVIIKPKRGHLGFKIYRAKVDHKGYHLYHGTKYPVFSYSSLASLINKLENTVSENFLIQQFIPLANLNGRIFDLRCLVQKNGQGIWEVTGTMSRVAMGYSYITNTGQMFLEGSSLLQERFPATDFLPDLQQISIECAEIMERKLGSLGEISVDLGIGEDGRIWIIELNGKPMKGIFRNLDEKIAVRIYQAPLEYGLYLTNRKESKNR